MFHKTVFVVVSAGLMGIAGCGDSSASRPAGSAGAAFASGTPAATSSQAANPTADTPEGAVTLFLSAVCAGNDEFAASMLTDLARQKTAEMDYEVAPPGSDSAQFTIGQVELLAEDAARVACTWSDLDEDGHRTEQQALWALRRGETGWRIAGVAPTIFPGEPPLLLNFENPEEMLEKLKWVAEEVRRREQAEMHAIETHAQQVGGAADGQLEARRPQALEGEMRR